jgi:uncharacterized protein (DUF433 family)
LRKRVFLRSPVRKNCTPGSVRGPLGNWRSYRDDTQPVPKLCTARSPWYESSLGGENMIGLTRITTDPAVMGGKPCIRGLRVTVGTIVGLVATSHREEEILRLYPYLETEDIREALSYAAWRAEEIEVPLLVP